MMVIDLHCRMMAMSSLILDQEGEIFLETREQLSNRVIKLSPT